MADPTRRAVLCHPRNQLPRVVSLTDGSTEQVLLLVCEKDIASDCPDSNTCDCSANGDPEVGRAHRARADQYRSLHEVLVVDVVAIPTGQKGLQAQR